MTPLRRAVVLVAALLAGAAPVLPAAATSGASGAFELSEASQRSDRVVAAEGAATEGAALEDGTYVSIEPARVLDTRRAIGIFPAGPLGATQTLSFDPALYGDIPDDGVSAVMLNLTGTAPTATTFVRAWPAGTTMPTTSSLNLVAGQTRANQVVVPVGPDGRVSLYNSSGTTHLVVDVQGFYSTAGGVAGGGYHPLTPERVLDTRRPPIEERLPGGYAVWVVLPASIPATVTTADVNLTVTAPTGGGYLTAWSGVDAPPLASTVNYAPGQTVANHVVVPIAYDEEYDEFGFAVYASADTHVVVDVQGWYDTGEDPSGLLFTPTPPTRVADTRKTGGPLRAGSVLTIPTADLPPYSGLPAGAAHVVNLTATGADGAGYLTAWSGVGSAPLASSVNYLRAESVPNLATAGTGPEGQVGVTARISDTHVVVDHLGYFS